MEQIAATAGRSKLEGLVAILDDDTVRARGELAEGVRMEGARLLAIVVYEARMAQEDASFPTCGEGQVECEAGAMAEPETLDDGEGGV